MLVGSGLAGLAYKRSGGSYEVTFGLSVAAAAISLMLVSAALGADARAGAAARQVEGAPARAPGLPHARTLSPRTPLTQSSRPGPLIHPTPTHPPAT